ncbi:MAG: hypothetical protein WCV82_04565, partial [Candidatus Paceibacterota bacterium]
MTTLVVTKYGNFNQSTLLTNTAYDIALTIRTAQTYGLSVKNVGAIGAAANFTSSFGVDFNIAAQGTGGANTCTGGNSDSGHLVLFADTYPALSSPPGNGVYDLPNNCDTPVTEYALTRGATITAICAGGGLVCTDSGLTQLDVTFRRPNPNALICVNGNCATLCGGGITCAYAEITLRAVDGSTRIITIRKNGQIGVI